MAVIVYCTCGRCCATGRSLDMRRLLLPAPPTNNNPISVNPLSMTHIGQPLHLAALFDERDPEYGTKPYVRARLNWHLRTFEHTSTELHCRVADFNPITRDLEVRIHAITKQLAKADTRYGEFTKTWFARRQAERERLIRQKKTITAVILRPIESRLIDIELEIEKVKREILVAAM
ncbi:hypothetical protein GE09DRAFT_1211778 [Coniochaeta sp. 2T2.1]|nr:hypothetical protein GE09DRAFT_1211778 [Coniochaeta sp. 2T2.1]